MEAPAIGRSRRERFRHWRHARPFWGCALTLIFAVELYAATAAPMGLVVLQGVTVLGTIVLSATLLVLALATLHQPLLRTISGPLVVLLSLLSLLVSNFGGFVVGMLLGLTGGGMIFAWSPTKNAPAFADAELPSHPAGEAPWADAEPWGGGEPWAGADTDVIPLAPEETAEEAPEDALPGGPAGEPAESDDPPVQRSGRHRSTLLAIAWLLPVAATALVLAGPSATPAVAQTAADKPADFPCLIPFLCPSPTPTPAPTPGASAPSPSPSRRGLFDGLLPKASATPTPSASAACDPTAYPTSDGTPVGAVAALAARVLQACAKAGKANPGTANEVSTVAIQPSLLKADRLTLEDLTYHGTVKLATATGTVTVMDFSATKLTIVGMNLAVPFNANTIRLNGTSNTATISGNVRLYASDLSGRALDLLPLTFTANPPPLLPQFPLPTLFFTGATSHVALVSADSIRTGISIQAS